jgi:hypothetical protein
MLNLAVHRPGRPEPAHPRLGRTCGCRVGRVPGELADTTHATRRTATAAIIGGMTVGPSDSSRVTDSSAVIESLGITAVVRGRNVRPGRADGADAEPAAEGHQRRLGSKRVRAPRGSR